MSKIRWMPKLLCSAKLVLWQHVFNSLTIGTYTTKQLSEKLQEFVIFVSLIQNPWWNICDKAVDAPLIDLYLSTKSLEYKALNSTMLGSATTALSFAYGM